MKKLFIALSAVVFALVACNKEAPVVENEPAEATKLAFDFNVNRSDDTKAVKTAWEIGDKIYVFFEDISGEGKYLTLSYNGSAWTSSTNTLTVSDFGGDGSTVTMHAVFFPFEQPEITAVDEGFTFKTKSEGHTAATAGLGIYTYYMTNTPESATCTVTVDGEIKTLGGTLSMTLPAGFVQFYIPAAGGKYNADYKYRLSIEGVKPMACVAYNAVYKYGGHTDGQASVAKVENNFSTRVVNAAQPMWGYKYGEGIAFSGIIDGTWDSATDHIIYLFDTEAAAKTKTVNAALVSHGAVNFTSVGSWGPAATAPSTVSAAGVQWGTFNLGATVAGTEEASFGWYFTWGDIIPQRSRTESHYLYWGYGSQRYWENETIHGEALKDMPVDLTGDYAIYDAAKAFLGPEWRMPTHLEQVSLIQDYGWSFGNNGALVANTAQGNLENYITFPKAGRWSSSKATWDDSVFQEDDGSSLSSTTNLEEYVPGGQVLVDYSLEFVAPDAVNASKSGRRQRGRTVRPVRDLN